MSTPTEPRVTNIALDVEQMPATITLELPIRHAATVARILGQITPATGANHHTTEVFFCLSMLFDRFYDDGLDGYRKEHG